MKHFKLLFYRFKNVLREQKFDYIKERWEEGLFGMILLTPLFKSINRICFQSLHKRLTTFCITTWLSSRYVKKKIWFTLSYDSSTVKKTYLHLFKAFLKFKVRRRRTYVWLVVFERFNLNIESTDSRHNSLKYVIIKFQDDNNTTTRYYFFPQDNFCLSHYYLIFCCDIPL